MAMASGVNAAGFRLSEQDAKANGMGNSFVAVADNASAVWYNPAAITDLEKTNLSLGTVMVAPAMKHDKTTGGSDEIKNTLHIPPYLYATHKLNEKWALGFGFNAPFGLSTEWDKATAITRYVSTLSDIKAFNYNLNGAYKVNDKLSVALGADYVYLDAKLANIGASAPFTNREIMLKGTGHGWGYNAAALYKLNDKWNFGANYRSLVKIDVDGTAKIAAAGVSNPATTKITLPDTFQIGAGYKVNDKWLVSATADYTDWTTYHALTIKSATLGGSVTLPKDWTSVWGFHAGTEYKYSDTWKFRGGAFYDLNPVKEKYFETRVPDSDRLALSVGAGWTKGNIVVDVSYTYLMFMNRTIHDSVQDLSSNTLNGTYKSAAHLPAIGVSYKF
jgi:long-chain fatty acid transport protein